MFEKTDETEHTKSFQMHLVKASGELKKYLKNTKNFLDLKKDATPVYQSKEHSKYQSTILQNKRKIKKKKYQAG